MNKLILTFVGLAIVMFALMPTVYVAGQRRRVVVRRPEVVRHPVVHTTLVVHRGHPIRRALPGTVIVRPAHKTVIVGAPLVFLPPLTWTVRAVSLPSRDRLVWQDSEQINRDEGWVDTSFGIDSSGNALILGVNGVTQLNFAEVTFANGNVQVVDFNERTHGDGIYKLLDFADGRHVSTVRILAKSQSDNTRLAVYLSK
jgi:hypothetical protein